ncbi:O-antigen ligase family protein [Actinoplanes sp. TRM 88003]|uniref:O-antigen ligase family protein n=1 Tax=Paractinoplanes aksuensis TaxID=2939490 RepID=A0ABT1DLP1_9ACTN|nr:O-antigen ligase family protein [Actinoplanes aksuensis]MCO8271758.1 O-antigen ligase family protein [Actinoplanes aksuensis]
MTAPPAVHPGDLEPSLVNGHTYLTRRRVLKLDAATLIGLMLVLLTFIPARLIIPGTTDVGRPAIVICLGLFVWWVLSRLNPHLVLTGNQPIRWVLLIYWLSILASYGTGFLRGLTGMEANSSDRWLISVAAFSGVILAAADGISNWDRFRSVLSAFVWCAAFLALVGLVETALARDVTQFLVLPGLAEKGPAPELQARGGGLRVASNTTHYIELSAVLATALPFAIHLARFAVSKGQRRRFAIAALLIGAGIPATISRTGIVAVLIMAVCLMPLWTWRLRYNGIITCLAMLGVLAAVKPSFAATLLDMFTNYSDDPSITSRTERYELVGYYFSQTPWFGRGTGTWVPPQYQYLDNQWLATALCNGIVGVAALALLFLTALVLAYIALRRASTPEDKHVCAALISTQLIAMFVSATFDSLWFDTYATVVALTIGLCGAVWRFTHPARHIRTSTPGH